jgi:hypothetical protein
MAAMRSPLRFVLPTLLAAALPVYAQTSATNSTTPLSTRVVAYTIEAKVDPDHHTLDATETLTYKNLTGQPLTTFPFHLYLNAFRPESSFTSETHFGGGIRDNESEDEYAPEKRGKIEIAHIDAVDYGDLTATMRFTAPDDGNAQDHTVAEITLPRPLAPGDSITFHLTFHDVFPLSVARNGYKRDFLMGGQWYPKVGVFWHGAWNCHQYHATTEFFSDFGTFNVHLTIPQRFIVGASGVPTGDTENANGTKTLGFQAEDVGDFAFAASPKFVVTDGTFLSSMGPVKIHVLALKASGAGAGARYLDVMQKSMQQFDTRYGPYPYKMITVIDPEPGSQIGGMEYPTLITGDTSWFEPTHITEVTAEHEFGHQYWYGMVATNEFEEAWLDEGINSYTEVAIMAALYGRDTSVIDTRWVSASDAELQRIEYMGAKDYDPVTRAAWKFRNSNSYGGVTYGKTATLLATLEGVIGKDTMDDAMRTYFMRYRFSHPTTEDFLRTIEEVAIRHGKATATGYIPQPPGTGTELAPSSSSDNATPQIATIGLPLVGPYPATKVILAGSSLRPFFEQAVYGTRVLDYAISDISSDRAKWWLPEDSKDNPYRDTVEVHRKGDFILPVTIEVVFADGTRLREHWDGVDRWTRFTYTRSSKIVSAEVDPDHVLLMDANLFNNSITKNASNLPTRKIAAVWTAGMQLLAQFAGWIV